MNTRILSLLCGVMIAGPLRGQVSTMIPPEARDSLAASDRRSATASRDRHRNLDSLAAGRRRWARAEVTEYRIQTHTDCFCIYRPGDLAPRPSLLAVRAGAIIDRSWGPPTTAPADELTVDSLFARVERDLRDPGRVVRQFRLDQRYGFPREYHAETPSIPDLWLWIHVDSFAVVSHRRAAVTRRPSNER
jgi:Family of unknown function (DUF6174)